MKTVPARSLIVLVAAALMLSVAGCQRAGERTAAERDGASPATPSARDRADPLAGSGTPARTTGAPNPAGLAAAGGPKSARTTDSAKSATTTTDSAKSAGTTGGAGDTRTMGAASAPADSQTMGAAAERVDDASITAKVSAAIAADKELKPLKIDVDTQNGIVTLSGLTPTAAAKEHADSVARTVKGVVSVNNQLTLQTS